MEMDMESKAPEWRAIPLGPWERYSRDLDGGRRVIVTRGMSGGWVRDLWSVLDLPVYLDLGESATAQGAMDDADRAAAEYAGMTDEELINRNGIDAFAGVVTLRIVTIGIGKRCVACENDIDPGLAAEQTRGGAWLWCGSCACRNPGSVIADEMAVTA